MQVYIPGKPLDKKAFSWALAYDDGLTYCFLVSFNVEVG